MTSILTRLSNYLFPSEDSSEEAPAEDTSVKRKRAVDMPPNVLIRPDGAVSEFSFRTHEELVKALGDICPPTVAHMDAYAPVKTPSGDWAVVYDRFRTQPAESFNAEASARTGLSVYGPAVLLPLSSQAPTEDVREPAPKKARVREKSHRVAVRRSPRLMNKSRE